MQLPELTVDEVEPPEATTPPDVVEVEPPDATAPPDENEVEPPGEVAPPDEDEVDPPEATLSPVPDVPPLDFAPPEELVVLPPAPPEAGVASFKGALGEQAAIPAANKNVMVDTAPNRIYNS